MLENRKLAFLKRTLLSVYARLAFAFIFIYSILVSFGINIESMNIYELIEKVNLRDIWIVVLAFVAWVSSEIVAELRFVKRELHASDIEAARKIYDNIKSMDMYDFRNHDFGESYKEETLAPVKYFDRMLELNEEIFLDARLKKKLETVQKLSRDLFDIIGGRSQGVGTEKRSIVPQFERIMDNFSPETRKIINEVNEKTSYLANEIDELMMEIRERVPEIFSKDSGSK